MLSFRVIVEERDKEMISEAVVKVKVDDEIYLNAGEGNGPVNALDVALRKDLGKYQRFIDDLELVDFKVRILNGGTGATTRVLIESRDGKGNRWFTVGVSPNIVDASFQALSDCDHLQAGARGRGCPLTAGHARRAWTHAAPEFAAAPAAGSKRPHGASPIR